MAGSFRYLLHAYRNAEICKQVTECMQNMLLGNLNLGIARIHPICWVPSKTTFSNTPLKDIECLYMFECHQCILFSTYFILFPRQTTYKGVICKIK